VFDTLILLRDGASVHPQLIRFLDGYARLWIIEVAFYTQKQFLGFEDPQNQTAEAVARTAPLAGLVHDLVLLWYAARIRQGRPADWIVRPWYRSKTIPSFLDMLTTLRQEAWRLHISAPPSPAPVALNSPTLGKHPSQVAA
jgi:hypothetical protein